MMDCEIAEVAYDLGVWVDKLWAVLRYRHGNAQAKREAVELLAKMLRAKNVVIEKTDRGQA